MDLLEGVRVRARRRAATLRRSVGGFGPLWGAGRPPQTGWQLAPWVRRAAAAWGTIVAGVAALGQRIKSSTPALRWEERDELGSLTKAQLYREASRLGVPGRSRMNRDQLAAAIRRARGGTWSVDLAADRVRAGVAFVWPFLARTPAAAGRLASAARALPRRSLILSLVMLAAGVLGLVLAYAVAPQEELAAPVLRANRTVRIETITGPGGTTTLVVTKTKQGEIQRIPLEIRRTITGPGGTVRVVVAGPTTTRTVRQVHQITETQVVTNVKPVTEVVTNVVTQPETVVVTETVVVEVTTTVATGP